MPPRVMQVMAGAPVGGVETFFFDAVLALAGAGVPQHAVIRPNTLFQIGRLKAAGVPYSTTAFSPWYPWPTKRALAHVVTEFQPDIIQYWSGRAGMHAPQTRAKQVGWYGGYRERWRFASCTHFIGITHDLVRHIREQGVPPERIGLIHTFAEYQTAPPLDRAAYNTPKDAPLLLALARLHWKKGLDVLLDAVARVPGAYLWIAGEGEDRAKLEAQTARLGLKDRVRFLGWRNDREALLATADICVFPSRYEPFGTVTIEAWAAGTPLVAAASQGPGAYVVNEKNGLLVPVDDTDALAGAIRRVIDDSALRARIVAGGRETYEQHFTKQVYVRDMLAFYDRVMESK
ncbi:MAG TPA: glycosyltransferase family 4 protein [Rhizomicrobium sp.]|nr:glycosyltransferase family 4 protein [Rhizomicrobium sp.]